MTVAIARGEIRQLSAFAKAKMPIWDNVRVYSRKNHFW
jgi:hypothetical protein